MNVPLAFADQGDFTACVGDGMDVYLVGGDHHVGVDIAIIASDICKLLIAHRLSSVKAKAVSRANCNVAGGIFIKQDLFKDQAALVDG